MQAALGMIVLGVPRERAYLRPAAAKMLGSQQGCLARFFLHGTNIHHREHQKYYFSLKKHLQQLRCRCFI